ncbi:hypothetical protein BCV70DRAFT_202113 [Testicularia cyperi]|uniref:Uncharacterized protein n=1 Tax=Testicularia cyperi TaxID=1882483 RepID=A0A317XJA6_9BASI|nr:hypothetical protein BCV70DRAFT_202113 [Testicularia cyperi]
MVVIKSSAILGPAVLATFAFSALVKADITAHLYGKHVNGDAIDAKCTFTDSQQGDVDNFRSRMQKNVTVWAQTADLAWHMSDDFAKTEEYIDRIIDAFRLNCDLYDGVYWQ